MSEPDRARAVAAVRAVASTFVVGMLGFAALPLARAWGHPVRLGVGLCAFTALGWCYVRLVRTASRGPWRATTLPEAAAVTVLALTLPVLDPTWQVLLFAPGAAVLVAVRPRWTVPAAVAVLAAGAAIRVAVGVPADAVGYLLIQDALTAFASAAVVVLVAFVDELFTARAELARLAVAQERLRFAGDLHDALGHHLSAIALKSELALRLTGAADPARLSGELADIHRLARRSLADVRAVVAGYRSPSLLREVHGVRTVLQAAGVACEVRASVGELPAPVAETMAWAVREAATNVLRHAGATRCEVSVAEVGRCWSLVVSDDGAGTDPDEASGLGERIAALGGSVRRDRDDDGWFRVSVRIPRPAGP